MAILNLPAAESATDQHGAAIAGQAEAALDEDCETSVRDRSGVVGFAKLVGQLPAMIDESGEPAAFDAGAWMARWLTEPLPAFGGLPPADLMDTMEGQGLVSAALARIQSGAYG